MSKTILKTKFGKSLLEGLRFFLIVGIIYGIGYVILNYVPFFAKHEHYVIATGSMTPVIDPGDVVIIDNSVLLDDLVEGDIIAFRAVIDDSGEERVVVHYLASVVEDDEGVRTYQTKPHVSERLDDWELTDEDIIGIHVLTISNIGRLLLFAQSLIGRIIIIVDIVIIYYLFKILFKDKKKA